jgi:hypothetical protein
MLLHGMKVEGKHILAEEIKWPEKKQGKTKLIFINNPFSE